MPRSWNLRVTLFPVVAALLANSSPALALNLSPMFSDHMVLQQQMKLPVWGTAKPGHTVTVQLAGQSQTAVADASGAWRVTFEPLSGGEQPHEITVAAGDQVVKLTDVLVGEVWLASGQSNMEWPVRMADNAEYEAQTAFWPMIRVLDVPNRPADEPQTSFDSAGWKVCSPETVPHFSAVGYYFARHLFQRRHVPIGIVQCEWGGTPMEAWTSREALASVPQFADDEQQARDLLPKKQPNGQPMMWPQNVPTALFNGMLAPTIPFAIRGAIWYQGESNAGRHAEYFELSKLMIGDWRKRWGADFPFLLVQLSAWEPGGPDWPLLRQAQQQSADQMSKVGMVCSIDLGDRTDIHPRNKQDVGRRLALAARQIAYGERVSYQGPSLAEAVAEGSSLRLKFRHADGGVTLQDAESTGFEIAGEDGKFLPAEAKVDGSDVVVSAPQVERPQQVRYGWAAFPSATLFNGQGFPAAPFCSQP